MAKKPYNPGDRKSEHVGFKVTKEEYELLEKLATDNERTISGYVRHRVFNDNPDTKKVTSLFLTDEGLEEMKKKGWLSPLLKPIRK